jgi:hypothetical protein
LLQRQARHQILLQNQHLHQSHQLVIPHVNQFVMLQLQKQLQMLQQNLLQTKQLQMPQLS